jgi:hypothetical protein
MVLLSHPKNHFFIGTFVISHGVSPRGIKCFCVLCADGGATGDLSRSSNNLSSSFESLQRF